MKKNLLIKILVLIIAILLWIQQVLLKQHEIEYLVPVKLLNIPNDLSLQTTEIPEVNVYLRATGYDLISAKISQIAFQVDASDFVFGENRIELSERDLTYSKRIQLEVIDWDFREPIIVQLDKLVERQKPIKIEFASTKDEEFFIENKIVNAQQRVGIKGPLSMLEEIETVKTEPISQKMVIDSKITASLVIPNINVQLLKDKVILDVTHTKTINKTISLIPIKFPETANITIIPQKVSVMVSGPEELVAKMDHNSITATLEIDKVNKGFTGVIFELPSGVKIMESTPKRIQVIVNEENPGF